MIDLTEISQNTRSFVTELHIDSCEIQDLVESLVRSMEYRNDMQDTPQPDLVLAKLLAKAIGDMKEKIQSQGC